MPVQCGSLKILRAKPAANKVGVCKATFYAWQDPKSPYYQPTMPRPRALGKRAVGWLESELDEWLATRRTTRQSSGEDIVQEDPAVAVVDSAKAT